MRRFVDGRFERAGKAGKFERAGRAGRFETSGTGGTGGTGERKECFRKERKFTKEMKG